MTEQGHWKIVLDKWSFSVVVCEPRQNLPSGPWVSKGWEPLPEKQQRTTVAEQFD